MAMTFCEIKGIDNDGAIVMCGNPATRIWFNWIVCEECFTRKMQPLYDFETQIEG